MAELRWCVDTDAMPDQVYNNLGHMTPCQIGGWLGTEIVVTDHRSAKRYQRVLQEAGYRAELSRTK